MPAPEFKLPTTGTSPKIATSGGLEAGINAVSKTLFDQIGAISTGLMPAGNWDASGGSFPSGAERGTYYVINVAGTVDGAAFAIGDWLIPLVDGPETGTYADNWFRGDYSKVVPAKPDSAAAFEAGSDVSRGPGALWETKDGFRYEEVTTGEDLTNAAGVKLEVLPLYGPASMPEYIDTAFGMTDSLTEDRSGLFQQIIDKISAAGGGTLRTATKELLFLYPVFIPSNVVVDLGAGRQRTHIETWSGKSGYGEYVHFVFGDSREFNRARTDERRTAGAYGSFENTGFSDVPLLNGSNVPYWPDVNDPTYGLNVAADGCIQSSGSKVLGGRLTSPDDITVRSYAIWFGNCHDCHWSDGISRNMTQPFSMGNDDLTKSSYAVDCSVDGLLVERPHPVASYYTAGFMGYAKRCVARRIKSPTPVLTGSANGNGLHGNFCIDCVFEDFDVNVGMGTNSDGVGWQNGQRNVARSGKIRNAKKAVASFYSTNYSAISANGRNKFENIQHAGCVTGISTTSKYTDFINITGSASSEDILVGNNNATNNRFDGCDNTTITDSTGMGDGWIYKQNDFGKFKPATYATRFVTPDMFIAPNNMADVTTRNENGITLATVAGNFVVSIPLSAVLGCTYLNRYTTHITYGANSLTGGSAINIKLMRRAAFNSNISQAHTVIYHYDVPAPSSDSASDVSIDRVIGSLVSSASDHPVAFSPTTSRATQDIWLLITWTNPQSGSRLKTTMLEGRFK